MSGGISVKTLIFNKPAFSFLFFLSFVCFTFFWQIAVTEAKTQTPAGELPLHIVSDKMVAQKDTSMIEFMGNVKATRADSVVFADSIKIYYIEDNKDKGSDAQSNVKKIVSTGNVKYVDGDRKAFADKAVFTTKDEKLILTGKSPKLITGSSFVTGKKITFFKLQDKVIVESEGSKRVEALFNPEDNITKKQ